MTGRPHAESLARMEADGTMDQRRKALRAWFEAHPQGSPSQAVTALEFTFADFMNVVADSVLMDMRRELRAALSLVQGGEEDPTVRLSRFRARHPQIPVQPLSHAGPWQAEIPEEGSRTFITSHELRILLDRLAGLGYTPDGDETPKTPELTEAPDAGGDTTSSNH